MIQRRMLRFVFSKGPREHVGSEELKRLSWLSIPDRIRFFSMTHVFKIRSGSAPSYLSQFFVPIETVHSHRTRGLSYNFHVSRVLAQAPTSFAFTAIKDWNALPNSLKQIENINQFKTKLKQYLISEY